MHRASLFLQQKRDFRQNIAGGIAVFAVGTVIQYIFRALQAFDKENHLVSEDGKSSNKDVTPDTQASRRKLYSESVFGIDIGSSFSRVSLYLANSARAEIIENREGSRATARTVLHTGDNLVIGQIARSQRLMKSRQTLLSPVLLLGLLPSDRCHSCYLPILLKPNPLFRFLYTGYITSHGAACPYFDK